MSDLTIQDIAASTGLNLHNLSNLLTEAIRDDSNLEMEWLWLAKTVTSDPERRYCLYRALYINPQSTAAKQALATLSAVKSTSLFAKLQIGVNDLLAKLITRHGRQNATNQPGEPTA